MANVAIITRTKNRPLLLKRALKSVASQLYQDYVHIIVNDGGDASVVDELLALEKHNIKVFHNLCSIGMEAASNIGLKVAVNYEFAVIHDDDDSWSPLFLNNMVNYLTNNPEKVGVVCNINQIFENIESNSITMLSSRLFNPAVKEFQLSDFYICNQFVPIAFLYRFELHQKVGFYNESLPVCGDLDFHLRALQSGKIGKIDKVLANYHIRVQHQDKALINSVDNNAAHEKATSQVMEMHPVLPKYKYIQAWLRVKFFYRILNIIMRRYVN